ncbi:MAG: FHA domain-containing protein [Geminicoccales bacterium]
MRTLVIGRSPFADVVVADASVAPHHAELVLTDDDRLHLTDCGTEAGSWREGSGGDWQAVRQAFVERAEPLRLGDFRCTPADLLRIAGERTPAVSLGPDRASESGGGIGPRLRGRLERDALTGEIVRRRP